MFFPNPYSFISTIEYGTWETYMFNHLKSIKNTSIIMCLACNHLYIVGTRLACHQLACSI